VLASITVQQFRNIIQAELSPAPAINLILGENGSGKTSLLEAIFLLAMGRSFRSRFLKALVNKEHTQLTVFARSIDKTPIGLQYNLSSGLQIRLNNAPLKKLSDLAQHLPVQFIPANCHQFFELGPKFRRRMVDWGVFHVEHHFNFHWQSYKKSLQQRNAAIKQRKPKAEISLWDTYLVKHGTVITDMRKRYLKRLIEFFRPLFKELCPELSETEFTLRYLQGWNKESDLSVYLSDNLERDQALGYTRSGAHAADWSLRVDGADPYEMLSRGQQKLFFLALSMAQIKLLAETKQLTDSILMIDDLSSELDWHHQQTVISTLRTLPVQSFISTTNDELKTLLRKENDKLFHVKHGHISAELG
jgi:DNA replication and repair protein RecF